MEEHHMAEAVPAPVYVRYVGPGDAYLARYTIGPYRASTEIRKGEPVALPPDVAETLLSSGVFEPVDVHDAIAEIAQADAKLAADEAEWQARIDAALQRAAAEAPLREIQSARIEVMRDAVIAARAKGADEGQVVASAVARAVEFEADLKTLNES